MGAERTGRLRGEQPCRTAQNQRNADRVQRAVRAVLVRLAIESQRRLPTLCGTTRELGMTRAPIFLEQLDARAKQRKRAQLGASTQRTHSGDRKCDPESGSGRASRHGDDSTMSCQHAGIVSAGACIRHSPTARRTALRGPRIRALAFELRVVHVKPIAAVTFALEETRTVVSLRRTPRPRPGPGSGSSTHGAGAPDRAASGCLRRPMTSRAELVKEPGYGRLAEGGQNAFGFARAKGRPRTHDKFPVLTVTYSTPPGH